MDVTAPDDFQDSEIKQPNGGAIESIRSSVARANGSLRKGEASARAAITERHRRATEATAGFARALADASADSVNDEVPESWSRAARILAGSPIVDRLKPYADAGPMLREAATSLSESLSERDPANLLSAIGNTVLGALIFAGRAFSEIHDSVKPRNLRGTKVSLKDVEWIMWTEGIPFVLVPDGETAELLFDAPDASTRRSILAARADCILECCVDIVELCVDEDLAARGMLVRKAIDAYRDGHREAAQALATNVLDSLVTQHRHRGQLTRQSEFAAIAGLVTWADTRNLMPIPIVHRGATERAAPGTEYNRHSTAHEAGLLRASAQYSPPNAVQSIMLATSVLGHWQQLW